MRFFVDEDKLLSDSVLFSHGIICALQFIDAVKDRATRMISLTIFMVGWFKFGSFDFTKAEIGL
jgi:hypothetical protein